MNECRIIYCMPESEYHADPCPTPSLSVSIAKILLDKSPKHAWLAHPRLGGKRCAPSDKMDAGSLGHKLMLGSGSDVLVVDASDWRTKAAKEARAHGRATGKIVVLKKLYDGAPAMRDAWCKHLADEWGTKLTGYNEVTILWKEKTPYGPIWCRARLDNLDFDEQIIRDLKVTDIPHTADALSRSFSSMDYAVQAHAYKLAATVVLPDLAGRMRFQFIALEPTEPYCATPIDIDGTFAELGEMRWKRAVELWGECIHENKFQGYGRGEPVLVRAMPWALQRETEAQYEEF